VGHIQQCLKIVLFTPECLADNVGVQDLYYEHGLFSKSIAFVSCFHVNGWRLQAKCIENPF
jgi:hypothetical protein